MAEKKETAKKTARKGVGRVLMRGVIRLCVLAIATLVILGIGMARYDWKPFGDRLTWQRIAGRSSEEAVRISRPLVERLDGIVDDVNAELARSRDGAQETAGAPSESGSDDGLTEEDRAARDRLVEELGL